MPDFALTFMSCAYDTTPEMGLLLVVCLFVLCVGFFIWHMEIPLLDFIFGFFLLLWGGYIYMCFMFATVFILLIGGMFFIHGVMLMFS